MNIRNNNFALLHYLAAGMIILGHMHVLAGGGAPGLLGTNILEIGVDSLFLISGYLVAKSFQRDSRMLKFWVKRVLRIYPAFAVCVILCAVAGYFISGLPMAEYLPGAKVYVTENLLMRPLFHLPGVFVGNPYTVSVNGSLWTLPIELACFLVTPIYLVVVQKLRHKVPVSALVASVMSLCAIYMIWCCPGKMLVFWGTDWVQALKLSAFYLWGITYSLLRAEQLKKLCRADAALLLLWVCLCLGGSFSHKLSFFLLPYIIISFAFAGDGLFRDFLNHHDYVYGMYLWAFPVQQTALFLFRNRTMPPVLILFLISAGITLLLAMLTGKFVEEPVKKITAVFLK